MWLLVAPLALAAPRATVQVDPLTALLGFAHVQLEVAPSPSLSVYAGPHLRLYSPPWGEPEPYVGLGGELGLRWYPWGAAPEGGWLLGRGVLAHLRATDGETAIGVYASVLGGYTHLIADRWVVSGGAGIQRLSYTVGDYGVAGFAPALHTAVGIAL